MFVCIICMTVAILTIDVDVPQLVVSCACVVVAPPSNVFILCPCVFCGNPSNRAVVELFSKSHVVSTVNL